MTVLLAKAVAMALAQHPVVNASCRDGKSFTYNSNINIAVAVAIDGGLITPVLQDADKVYTVLIVNLISSGNCSKQGNHSAYEFVHCSWISICSRKIGKI